MCLVELQTPKGLIVLEYLGRRFYADDALPQGGKARDLPGLAPEDLRQRWLTQKRQRSPGPQCSGSPRAFLAMRVEPSVKDALARLAESHGMTMSRLGSEIISWVVEHGGLLCGAPEDQDGTVEPLAVLALEEARASVALDHDPDMQTQSVETQSEEFSSDERSSDQRNDHADAD